MSGRGAPSAPVAWLQDRVRGIIAFGIGAAVLMLAWRLAVPSGMISAGWLIGLVFWIRVALGSLTLLAAQAATGGRWGEALRPALAPAAATLPLFGLLLVPVFLDLKAIYPWAADPSAATRPEVASLYLNPAGWTLRAAAAVIGWSLFGLLLARPGGRRRAATGSLCLVFHTLALTLIAVDWILSIEPRFRSTAFPAALGVGQVMAALAWAALLRVEPAGEHMPGRAGDLASLLLAAVLGAAYLGFAQYLVSYYGNLPDKAAWYERRQAGVWWWLDGAAVVLASLLPFAALLSPRVRRAPGALAIVGLCLLVGVLAHDAWLIGPPFGAGALATAALGAAAIGGIWTGFAYGPVAAWLEGRSRTQWRNP
jgi:hypothetical protein